MRSQERVNPIVVGIDGSTAAINAAAWAVDEAISRRVPHYPGSSWTGASSVGYQAIPMSKCTRASPTPRLNIW